MWSTSSCIVFKSLYDPSQATLFHRPMLSHPLQGHLQRSIFTSLPSLTTQRSVLFLSSLPETNMQPVFYSPVVMDHFYSKAVEEAT